MLVPSISEFFPQLARFSYLAPQSLSLPWLIVFTTLAQYEGRLLDFTAGRGEASRRELEDALTPLAVTWLTLEHGAEIALLNSNNVEKVRDTLSAVAENAASTPAADTASAAPSAPMAAFAPAVDTTSASTPAADTTSAADSSIACSPLADAAIITQPGLAVAFTTADCLPLVCVNAQQRVVAAVHAGWRSLAAGIVERTIERLTSDYDIQPETLKVWIGPAIAGEDYEVGSEVRDALLVRPAITEAHFSLSPGNPSRFLADLPGAATSVLTSLGVPAHDVERCPFSTRRSPHLHSVRRDGSKAGRMATVVGVWEAG
jgi:YfiH family protein